MKLLVTIGLIAFSGLAAAQTCKMELYGPARNFITSIRTSNDRDCKKALQACANWKAWYYAPSSSRCYKVRDDGYAVIDYVRYPDYDDYYGYPGSPYSRVSQVYPTTIRVCDYEARGRETCRIYPQGSTYVYVSTTSVRTQICQQYSNGTQRCWDHHNTGTSQTQLPDPQTQPMPRPRPEPQPQPQPQPQPRPEPTPTTPAPTTTTAPSTDATRVIEAGETVIFNSALHMVVSTDNNFYNLKPMGGRDRDVVKDVARQYVAVTRGCNVGFCANDSVIVVGSASYAAVAGIEYDGKFVLKTVDGNETLSFGVTASSLAWTKGCSPEGPRKVCIGNVVMKQNARNNGYYTVAGIQLDGNVVLEDEREPKKLTTNVRPDTLIITR